MTRRITIDEYRALTGQVRQPKRSRKGEMTKRRLALLVLFRELEEIGIRHGGRWKKGMTVEPDTIYEEYPGIEGRKYRLDLAIPSRIIAVEIQGGGPGMAHHTITGRRRDMVKSSQANLHGWTYLEVNWSDVFDGTLQKYLTQALTRVTK